MKVKETFEEYGGCGCLFIPSVYVLIFFMFFFGGIKDNIKHQLIYKNQLYETLAITDSITIVTHATQFSEISIDNYFILEDSSRITKYRNYRVGDSIKRAVYTDKSGYKHKIYLPDKERIEKATWYSFIPFFLFPLILFIPVFYFSIASFKSIKRNSKEITINNNENIMLKTLSYYLDSYFILFIGYIISISLFFSAYSNMLTIGNNSVNYSSFVIFLKIIISVYIPIILVSVVKRINADKKNIYWGLKIGLRIFGYGNIIFALIQFIFTKSIEKISIVRLFLFIFKNLKEAFS